MIRTRSILVFRSLLIAIFYLAGAELLFQGLFFAQDCWSDQQRLLEKAEPYEGVPWARQYWREYRAAQGTDFYPGYEWRRKPFEGSHIRVSPIGIRHTWNPEFIHGQTPIRIFCFGGSTQWGTGARDAFTIPSIISKKINARSPRYQVTNFGEAGYVPWQESVLLLDQLRKGNIPDIVIFYDGVNNVLSTYQNGKAGLISNYARFQEGRERFGSRFFAVASLKNAWHEMSRLSATHRAWMVFWSLRRDRDTTRDASGKFVSTAVPRYGSDELESLARATAEDYIQTMGLIRGLERAYGFRTLFVWESTAFETTSLTAHEARRIMGGETGRDLKFLTQKTSEYVRKFGSSVGIIDLAHVFDGKRKSVFIDYAHLSEDGNEMIAQEIYLRLSRSGWLEKLLDPSAG